MKYLTIIILPVCAMLAGAFTAHAQSVTTICTFGNTNGSLPQAGLTLGPDGNFYGTTYFGGSYGYTSDSDGDGTVFRVTTNGTLTKLVDFNGTNGANPYASLTLGPDGNLYGTTSSGGSANFGTVFKLTTDGQFTTLVNFNGTNGSYPDDNLTLGPDGNLYGTTEGGGSTNEGTVFKMTTNGSLTTLVSFKTTNGDYPIAGLTFGPDGNFYGATGGIQSGGSTTNVGTIFKMATNGTLTTLVNFNYTNGSYPDGNLTLGQDGNFYGTTAGGGLYGWGTVFKLATNGTLTTLVNFNLTNGANPEAALTLGPDGNFYGTCFYGGTNTYSDTGTVFEVTTNGTLTTLVSFDFNDGSNPWCSLTLLNGNFYGTTGANGGGTNGGGGGTVFQLNLSPGFIVPPTNQTVVIGSTATFNCKVFGTAPFAYQWLSNGTPIAGATNASLTFSPALTNSVGNYQLEITNAYGSVTSQMVSLNVLLQPNAYSISNSGTGNFTVYLASLPNTTNRLWATTNVALNQWQVIATNVTDSNGLSQFLDTNTIGMPQKFYRLSYP